LKAGFDALKVERDALKVERDALKTQFDELKVERDEMFVRINDLGADTPCVVLCPESVEKIGAKMHEVLKADAAKEEADAIAAAEKEKANAIAAAELAKSPYDKIKELYAGGELNGDKCNELIDAHISSLAPSHEGAASSGLAEGSAFSGLAEGSASSGAAAAEGSAQGSSSSSPLVIPPTPKRSRPSERVELDALHFHLIALIINEFGLDAAKNFHNRAIAKLQGRDISAFVPYPKAPDRNLAQVGQLIVEMEGERDLLNGKDVNSFFQRFAVYPNLLYGQIVEYNKTRELNNKFARFLPHINHALYTDKEKTTIVTGIDEMLRLSGHLKLFDIKNFSHLFFSIFIRWSYNMCL
jgi:hypothetical protein